MALFPLSIRRFESVIIGLWLFLDTFWDYLLPWKNPALL
jgi:hypothetical protein